MFRIVALALGFSLIGAPIARSEETWFAAQTQFFLEEAVFSPAHGPDSARPRMAARQEPPVPPPPRPTLPPPPLSVDPAVAEPLDVPPLPPERLAPSPQAVPAPQQREDRPGGAADIRSIRGVGVDIRLPAEYDNRGRPLPLPEDVSSTVVESSFVYVPPLGPPWNDGAQYAIPPMYCHRPLYFEEINVERYGNSFGILQPVVSGAHFFATIPALPYMATIEKPWVCYAPEPWYPPPGVHAPWQPIKRYPLRLDAAAVETAVVIGLIALIP